MQPSLIPYLNFQGSTKKAMEFYQHIFGGELKMQTYGETFHTDKEDEKELIIHAHLQTEYFVIMASDGNAEHLVRVGNNVNLSISGSDDRLLRRYFNDLAEGGTVAMPLTKEFWGDTFGMLTDKFHIHWMINIAAA